MLRPLALLSLVFTACAAPKAALRPLALREPFAVVYRGGAAAADYEAPAAGSSPAAQAGAGPSAEARQTVDVRATFLDLDVADARALLATDDSSSRQDGSHRPLVDAALPLAGIRGAHLDPASVDATIASLHGRADLLMTPRVVVALGEPATMSVQERRAVVRSLDFLATEHAVIANPAVDRVDYGDTLTIRASQEGGGTQFAVSWKSSRIVSPVAVAETPAGALQIPAILRHELDATAGIQSKDALVLASIPGEQQGRVRVLFLVVEVHPASQGG